MDEKEFSDYDLKAAINNFLWSYLPGSASLSKAEACASQIFDIVKGVWMTANYDEDNQK